MKKHALYLSVLAIILASCGRVKNKNVTLWRNDKIAYGTYYAYHNLSYLFHEATITPSTVSPTGFYDSGDSNAAYIIIGNSVKPSGRELNAILDYAASGNHVFISAIHIGQNLLDSFRLGATVYRHMYAQADSMAVSILPPGADDTVSFAYPGFSLDNVFTKMDTSITSIVGHDESGRADFVRFTYQNGGSVCIHLAPMAFTNFFLLHKNNKRYFDMALSYLPHSIHKIKWDDYFRSHIDGADTAQNSFLSKLAAFLNNPVLRWACWLTLLLFAVIYFFESKRKQRPVPVVTGLRNSSLDFVQTIGRLYYQRHDNKNLAAKMSAHFLGHVRSKYNIATSSTDDAFAQKLSFRTGYPLEKIREIILFIGNAENAPAITDDQLLAFSKQTDEFYKQT